MTDFDANRLVTMLIYNFPQFLPQDPQGAAIKKGTWLSELVKYDVTRGEAAIKTLVQTCHFPPQLADFRDAIGVGVSYQYQDGLPGPTFGTEEGNAAMYTADPEHVKKVFEDLMRDLA